MSPIIAYDRSVLNLSFCIVIFLSHIKSIQKNQIYFTLSAKSTTL